jgi:hypothetical protein
VGWGGDVRNVSFLWKLEKLNFCGDVDFVSQGILWLFGVYFFVQLMWGLGIYIYIYIYNIYIYTERMIGDLWTLMLVMIS